MDIIEIMERYTNNWRQCTRCKCIQDLASEDIWYKIDENFNVICYTDVNNDFDDSDSDSEYGDAEECNNCTNIDR
jgi:hypothetical protein